jgi:hypothetical protein
LREVARPGFAVAVANFRNPLLSDGQAQLATTSDKRPDEQRRQRCPSSNRMNAVQEKKGRHEDRQRNEAKERHLDLLWTSGRSRKFAASVITRSDGGGTRRAIAALRCFGTRGVPS